MSKSLPRNSSYDRLNTMAPPPLSSSRIHLKFKGFSVPLPEPLWGAAQVALKTCSSSSSSLKTAAAAAFNPESYDTSTNDNPPANTNTPPTSMSVRDPASLAIALSFHPILSTMQTILILSASTLLCTIIYCTIPPPHPTTTRFFYLPYALGMAFLFWLSITVLRYIIFERQYAARQVGEEQLACPLNSNFTDVDGVRIHYTIEQPARTKNQGDSDVEKMINTESTTPTTTTTTAAAVHCLHGFGASSYSWSFVQQQLATIIQGPVTAHDMPGFGLSHRPQSSNYYTLAFNGHVARSILDQELGQNTDTSADKEKNTSSSTKKKKRVIMGHSMGAAAAAEGVIANPEGVSALILVAPAIVAFWPVPSLSRRTSTSNDSHGATRGNSGDDKKKKKKDDGDVLVTVGLSFVEELVSAQDTPTPTPNSSRTGSGQKEREEEGKRVVVVDTTTTTTNNNATNNNNATTNANANANHHHQYYYRAYKAVRVMGALCQATALVLLKFILLLSQPLLIYALRKLVRSRQFWIRGLSSAWTNTARVTSTYVDCYRYPQLVKGWELGILRFLRARFSEKSSWTEAVKEVLASDDGHLTQAERLAAVVEKWGIPVMVVHGVEDALVPVGNSRRLAKMLGGNNGGTGNTATPPSYKVQLVEIKQCGHIPHEECADDFLLHCKEFLSSTVMNA